MLVGMPTTAQCHQPRPGASMSNIVMAKPRVPAGGSRHDNCGDRLPPLQSSWLKTCACPTVPPALKSVLEIVKAAAGWADCAVCAFASVKTYGVRHAATAINKAANENA